MSIVVRFAPSPTGNIHIGNARTALLNWLYASQHDGQFILRFDDTDRERSTEAFAAGIERDLAWLGIYPHQTVRQSDRGDRHSAVTEDLKTRGLLYPCYETPDELDRKRRRQQARGLPPVYDRAALRLTEEEKSSLEAEGRQPHYRFLLPNHAGDPFQPARTDVGWDDLIVGKQIVDLASISDPVLVRGDGTWLYTLPSVVDDADLGVTHVIRGADHITNTGVQLALFEVLGAQPPAFAHHNLLTTASGEGLSKRLGSLSIASLAQSGYEPMAVASLAALIGGAGAVEPMPDMTALAERFDIAAIGRSPAKFDVAELDSLNRKLVHGLDWNNVVERFQDDAFGGHGEAFWLAIRENLEKVEEANEWWQRIENAEPIVDAQDHDFISQAIDCFPAGATDADTWSKWTSQLKTASGRKGRALFMPLRKAITGAERGPEMAAILPLVGRETVLTRLRQATNDAS